MIQANVAAAETLEARRARRRLPRARCALQGEARGAARVPRQPGAQAAGRGHAAGRRLQPVLQRAKSLPVHRPRQRDRAALAGAGRLCRRQPRPLRPEPAPLRAFHLADPPLRRPAGAPLADPRARAGRGRRSVDEEAARLADIAQAISDAERRAMAAERETNDRLIAAYPRRPRRRGVRRAHLGRHALRPVRAPARHRRRRLRAGGHHRQRLLAPSRGQPRADRRPHRRGLSAGRQRARASWSRRSRRPARCASRCCRRASARAERRGGLPKGRRFGGRGPGGRGVDAATAVAREHAFRSSPVLAAPGCSATASSRRRSGPQSASDGRAHAALGSMAGRPGMTGALGGIGGRHSMTAEQPQAPQSAAQGARAAPARCRDPDHRRQLLGRAARAARAAAPRHGVHAGPLRVPGRARRPRRQAGRRRGGPEAARSREADGRHEGHAAAWPGRARWRWPPCARPSRRRAC